MAGAPDPRSIRAEIRGLRPVFAIAFGLSALDGIFLFGCKPRSEVAPPPTRVIATAQRPSKLQLLGLPDNPDLAALPEIFAVYADAAEWKEGRTKFAYWHPGANDYAYFFEATRTGDGFHFQTIPEPPVGEDTFFYWDKSLGDAAPIRFYRTVQLSETILSPKPGFELSDPVPSKKVIVPIVIERKP